MNTTRVYDVLHRATIFGILGVSGLLCLRVASAMGSYVERLRRARRERLSTAPATTV